MKGQEGRGRVQKTAQKLTGRGEKGNRFQTKRGTLNLGDLELRSGDGRKKKELYTGDTKREGKSREHEKIGVNKSK